MAAVSSPITRKRETAWASLNVWSWTMKTASSATPRMLTVMVKKLLFTFHWDKKMFPTDLQCQAGLECQGLFLHSEGMEDEAGCLQLCQVSGHIIRKPIDIQFPFKTLSLPLPAFGSPSSWATPPASSLRPATSSRIATTSARADRGSAERTKCCQKSQVSLTTNFSK